MSLFDKLFKYILRVSTILSIFPSFAISLNASSSTSDIECFITPNIAKSLEGMKIYADESHSVQVTSDSPLKQTIAAGTTSSVTLYWVWEYDTGLLSGQNISFSINVFGKQIVS